MSLPDLTTCWPPNTNGQEKSSLWPWPLPGHSRGCLRCRPRPWVTWEQSPPQETGRRRRLVGATATSGGGGLLLTSLCRAQAWCAANLPTSPLRPPPAPRQSSGLLKPWSHFLGVHHVSPTSCDLQGQGTSWPGAPSQPHTVGSVQVSEVLAPLALRCLRSQGLSPGP